MRIPATQNKHRIFVRSNSALDLGRQSPFIERPTGRTLTIRDGKTTGYRKTTERHHTDGSEHQVAEQSAWDKRDGLLHVSARAQSNAEQKTKTKATADLIIHN